MKTTELIQALSEEVGAVKAVWLPHWRLFAWILVALPIVVLATSVLGPFRSGVLSQFATSPRFCIEVALGFLCAFSCAFTALVLCIPGERSFAAGVKLSSALLFLWFSIFVYGIWSPALAPSMIGKREFCLYECFAYGVPPFLLLFVMARRSALILRSWPGFFMGVAAVALPANLMQMACMYEPIHILKFHIFPVFAFALFVIIPCNRLLYRL